MPKGLTGFQKGHSRFRTDESYLLASKKISKALKGIKRGPMQEWHKKRISDALKGKTPKACGWNRGKKLSREHRINLGLVKGGKDCHFWKGGVANKNKVLRASLRFKLWRESVFERDKWTCQDCWKIGNELHPHHIKSFADYPKLRFATDNGVTLCKECHKKRHQNNKGFIKKLGVIDKKITKHYENT